MVSARNEMYRNSTIIATTISAATTNIQLCDSNTIGTITNGADIISDDERSDPLRHAKGQSERK